MKKIKYFTLLFLISLVAMAIIPGTLNAGIVEIDNPLATEDFEVIIDNIINFIFNIAVVLAPLMIIIAGFLFVTAGGNLEQIKRAKNIIIWTSVGFFVILLARGIMGVIMNLLGVS